MQRHRRAWTCHTYRQRSNDCMRKQKVMCAARRAVVSSRLRTPFPPYAQLPSRAVIAARMAPPPGTSAELSGLIGPP